MEEHDEQRVGAQECFLEKKAWALVKNGYKGRVAMELKRLLMVGVVVVLAGNISPAVAGVASKRFDKATGMCRELTFNNSGWVSEGHDIFRNTCKACHSRNSGKGAPFLYTESRTMEGWNLVFYKKNVKCAQDGSWGNLSREQLLQVNDYLFWNAFGTYDANTAERCG